MESVIQVKGLVKHFREVKAVDGLSFTVNRGEIYGFLGQNGAGKSTTIRMLLALVEPTAGSIQIFGKDLKGNKSAILRSTGAVIEKPDLYKYLTAAENISIFARLSGRRITSSQIKTRLERVGLAERANSKVKTFSQGMKQRLGIAVALVHDPDLIILDEPVNGLDPQGIADMRNLILHLGRDLKKTVLVSSHLLSEVEQIADRLLIINNGKKMVEGSIAELLDPSKMLLELNTGNNEHALKLMKESKGIGNVSADQNKLLVELHEREIPHLMRFLVNHNVEILSVISRHSLENYFLSLTAGAHVDTTTN
jgi:ABC-type multidrug transport system ATPase subunit